MNTFHIACGQTVCTPGDISGNLDQIETLAREAARHGARFMLCGEGAITGYAYTPDVIAQALRLDGSTATRLSTIADELNIGIAAGTLEHSDEGIHISHFVALPGRELFAQRKHKLNGEDRGANVIAGPEQRTVFEVDGVKMAIVICADAAIPNIYGKLAEAGCHIYLQPSAGGEGREFMMHPDDLNDETRRALYLTKMEAVCFPKLPFQSSIQHQMATVCTNLSGDDGVAHYHPGHSLIIDGLGRLHVLLPGEYIVDYLQPRLIHAEIPIVEPRVVQ